MNPFNNPYLNPYAMGGFINPQMTPTQVVNSGVMMGSNPLQHFQPVQNTVPIQQQPHSNVANAATPSQPAPQYDGPGLMQHQKEKYGSHLFTRNETGEYTCFFAGCGKQLSANFSRHISRHEQDGDPLDPNVEVRGTYQPPTTPVVKSTPTRSHSTSHLTSNMSTPNTPLHHSASMFGTPMQHPIGVIPPAALPIPFALSAPVNPNALTLASASINPALLGLPPPQIIQQQQQPRPPQPLHTPIKTRASSAAASNGPTVPMPTQQEMESKGIPYQVCQHPNHEKWWQTSPVLPQTEFYNRASKCKKCYIRQQQDSKRLRSMDRGSTSISNIISTVGGSDESPQQLPVKLPRTGPVMATQSMILQNQALGLIKPPTLPITNPTPTLPPTTVPTISPTSTINTQALLQQQAQLQFQQQLQQLQTQQAQMQQLQAAQQQFQVPFYHPQVHSAFSMQQFPFTNNNSALSLNHNQIINKMPFPRPKIEPSQAEFEKIATEKLKEIVSTLMKDPRSKWFREPVDPVKFNIPDYPEIIKQPRDLGTIEKNLGANKYVNSFHTINQDIKLVFSNAKTYNDEESEVFEMADELDKYYDELHKKAMIEASAQTQLDAEFIKHICSICRGKPVPYKRPANQPNGTSTTTNGSTGSSTTEGSSASNTPPIIDEVTPVPLLLCEGSCLRAFHLHCLGLPVTTNPPWMCEDCHQGRPVLHFDNVRNEYFYYYYEGVVGVEDTDTDTTMNGSGGNAASGSEDDPIVSNLGMLTKEEKINLRKEEEKHRVRDMYFDPVWCMWRCKSTAVMKQRDERQKPILTAAQNKAKKGLKQQQQSKQQQQQQQISKRKTTKKR